MSMALYFKKKKLSHIVKKMYITLQKTHFFPSEELLTAMTPAHCLSSTLGVFLRPSPVS